LILHPSAGASRDAEVFELSEIVSFVPNKPKPELKEQKILLQFCLASEEKFVIDFGSDKDTQVKLNFLLKEYAGDKATERKKQKHRYVEELANKRAQFLIKNPIMKMIYDSLVEKEKSITSEEFWAKHQHEVDSYAYDAKDHSQDDYDAAVPEPLKGESSLQIGRDRKLQMFTQFPELQAIFESSVPHLLSEKDFWRRFFSCRFFWKSQGKERETAKDPLFDVLKTVKESASETNRSQYLPVPPSVDLTMDWLGEEKPDRSEPPEVAGSSVETHAFSNLTARFNAFSEKRVGGAQSRDELKNRLDLVASERKAALEKELDHSIGTEKEENDPQSKSATTSDLSKLLSNYVITRHRLDASQLNFSQEAEFFSPVTEVTVKLTSSLKNPSSHDETVKSEELRETSRNMVHGSREYDFMAERVYELLRHFWATTPPEIEKRFRILSALKLQKTEAEAWLGKANPGWHGSVRNLLISIEQAFKIHEKFNSF
jgi:BSD domain